MRLAVILFNLGGPDNLDSVKPFLFNLFHDPLIIRLPQPFRYLLAKTITFFRHKKSQNIYSKMGGRSTILEETERQVQALELLLNNHCSAKGTISYDVITMMRYWYPMSKEVLDKVKKGNYDQVLLIPLYPHFSTTTTLSSLRDWFDKAKNIKTSLVCCYYNHPNFIEAHLDLIRKTLKKVEGPRRLIFSAHSIPQKVSDEGDPYKSQIEKTVELIMAAFPDHPYSICYQSKVGRLKWLEPSIESELLATKEKNEKAVVIPITFTSEHSETLVELDLDYADFAKTIGLDYYRVPTLSSHPLFIQSLADLVIKKLIKDYPNLYKEITLHLPQADFPKPCREALCCQKIPLF